MRKRYSMHPLMKTVAGFTATTVLGLSMVQPVFAFNSIDDFGAGSNAQVYGLSFTGDFNLNRMSVNTFAHTPVEGIHNSYYDGGIVSLSNGMIKTDLPLLTFGDDVRYPGIFYNHDGEQFYNHVLGATEGVQKSESLIWAYVLGGLAVAGIIYTISDSTDNNTPPIDLYPEEEVVDEEDATVETTTDTGTETATDPVPEETDPATE